MHGTFIDILAGEEFACFRDGRKNVVVQYPQSTINAGLTVVIVRNGQPAFTTMQKGGTALLHSPDRYRRDADTVLMSGATIFYGATAHLFRLFALVLAAIHPHIKSLFE